MCVHSVVFERMGNCCPCLRFSDAGHEYERVADDVLDMGDQQQQSQQMNRRSLEVPHYPSNQHQSTTGVTPRTTTASAGSSAPTSQNSDRNTPSTVRI
jgi:hypothetical protein